MTQSSTDSSLVERLRVFEIVLASDRPYAASVAGEAADRISTLERELEEASEQRDERRADSDAYKAAMKSYFEQLLSEHNAKVEAQRALTAAEAKAARMGEALEWYGERARLARLIHSGGDPARFDLSDDGGKRARSDREGGE